MPSPPSILLHPWGSLGDLHPYLALGRALNKRGASVTVATLRSYESTVRAQGFRYVPAGPHFEPTDPLVVQACLDRKNGTIRLVGDLLLANLDATFRELEEPIAAHDRTVTHPLGFAAMAACELHGKPWVTAYLAPLGMFSIYDWPILPQSPRLSRTSRRSPALAALHLWALRRMLRPWGDTVNGFYRRVGLRGGAYPWVVGRPSPHLNLALFDPTLGPAQPDWPKPTVLTGFCRYEEGPVSKPDHERLQRFLNEGPPPVVVTLGSSAVHAAPALFDVWREALTHLRLRGLFVLGEHRLAGNEGPSLPFLSLKYAPYHLLFPSARAVVCQGGIGTVSEAVVHGKPMVVLPFSHDQWDNAARIERRGLGLTMNPARLTPRKASRALARALAMARPADAPHPTPDDGADRAAQAILAMGHEPGPRPSPPRPSPLAPTAPLP